MEDNNQQGDDGTSHPQQREQRRADGGKISLAEEDAHGDSAQCTWSFQRGLQQDGGIRALGVQCCDDLALQGDL